MIKMNQQGVNVVGIWKEKLVIQMDVFCKWFRGLSEVELQSWDMKEEELFEYRSEED